VAPAVTAPPLPAPATAQAAATPARLTDHPLFLPLAGGGTIAVLLIVALVVLLAGGNTKPSPIPSGDADKIVTEAAVILSSWSSYHARLHTLSGQGTADVKYADSTSLSIDTTKAGVHVRLLTAGGRYFIAGDAAFFKNNPVLAQHAAEKWLEFKNPTSLLSPADAAPAVGASCILENHGTLTKKAESTVGGRSAIEIDDAGDKPGTTPAKLFIATDGRFDLLRVEETAVTNGRPVKQCVDGFGTAVTDRGSRAIIDFDQINAHIDVSAPSAINLDDPPFCGNPITTDLSMAAQQFLLLRYDSDVRHVAIAAECGCPRPTFDQFHQGMVDTVASDTAWVSGLARLPLDATQRALADRVIRAFRPLIANETIQARTRSFAEAIPLFSAHRQLSGAVDEPSAALRNALGVPTNTCSFEMLA
jgi:hypothetical protein